VTFDLFASSSPSAEEAQLISLPGAELLFFPRLFSSSKADAYLAALTNDIHWQQENITLYGQTHPVPRLTAWYGDTNSRYTYSGISANALPWNDTLLSIKQGIEEKTDGKTFNSVLLNLYRNGADGVAWHSDDEAELGSTPVIGSVTFRQERPFQLRHRHDKSLKYSLSLPHGSFLLMRGDTQKEWLHQITKSAKPMQPRINLTFRTVK
jgi:alkylated DNA repair dioxygenase AlkB